MFITPIPLSGIKGAIHTQIVFARSAARKQSLQYRYYNSPTFKIYKSLVLQ